MPITQEQVRQQSSEAAQRLREALHLPAGVNDVSILGTALARAAAKEVRQNANFARDVRREYDALVAARGQPLRRTAQQAEPLEPLIALRHTGRTSDPYAPPDPQELIYVYGANKLGRALHEYTLAKLKMTADRIQQQHPGTKPTNRASKVAVIEYIVKYTGS